MAEVTITLAEEGPYAVSGPVELTAPDGTRLKPPAGPLLLCRCGESATKPFCDGADAGAPTRCARQRVGGRRPAPPRGPGAP